MKLYQVYINSLLVQIKSSGCGLQLGPINVSCPASADDLAILSIHKQGLNEMLNTAYEYSKTWWFDWGFDKCVGIVWGKDKSPNIPIMFGNEVLKEVDQYKHLGIMLHNERVPSNKIMEQRVGKGRSSVFAARGIGSARVPMNPAIMSNIYWSVSVPRMLYGVEVVPLSGSDIQELEKAHRQNGKIIQNIPQNVASPTVYSTLGWLSMESYIAQIKMLFIWKIAICLRGTIYFRALSFIIQQIISGVYKTSRSPIHDMVKWISKFNALDELVNCIFFIDCDSEYLVIKHKINKTVLDVEHTRWRATCLMYSSLEVFRKATSNISMNCWWYFARSMPNMSIKVSSVMAVLAGGQPSRYQHNFDREPCALCDGCYDSATHILFDCQKLEPLRYELWQKLILSMPHRLAMECNCMSNVDKLVIMLGGYGNNYIHEWREMYINTANYIHELYRRRSRLYEEKLTPDT